MTCLSPNCCLLPVRTAFLFLLFNCFLTGAALSQDFNGVWRGKLTQAPGGCYPEYFIEIQIQHSAVQLAGTTYDYYDTSRYVKLNFNGKVNMTTKRMVLMEERVLRYSIPPNCVPCIKTYDLTLTKLNNEEVLSGTWDGVMMGTKENCPHGKVTLKRVVESAFGIDDAIQSPELAAIQRTLPPISRKIELVQTLVLDTSAVKLELYDNGQIDGDTISIFLNQQLILYKKGLTAKPITVNVPVIPSKDYEMIMYAENLGSIPPNTALMVVTSGKKRYEVYLSSTEQKSAAVRFKYEKK
ncbi:MAG: hypothetical protein INR73_14520 [Williamsia sp.]|nr:hypothetical protein [Williamsia sp.]